MHATVNMQRDSHHHAGVGAQPFFLHIRQSLTISSAVEQLLAVVARVFCRETDSSAPYMLQTFFREMIPSTAVAPKTCGKKAQAYPSSILWAEVLCACVH